MKAVPPWVTYSVYRVLMFVVPLTVLLLMHWEGWVAALVAAVVGLCLSYIFLRKPRDKVARDIYEVRHRASEPVHPDAESEDAALDRAEANAPRPDQPPSGQSAKANPSSTP